MNNIFTIGKINKVEVKESKNGHTFTSFNIGELPCVSFSEKIVIKNGSDVMAKGSITPFKHNDKNYLGSILVSEMEYLERESSKENNSYKNSNSYKTNTNTILEKNTNSFKQKENTKEKVVIDEVDFELDRGLA
jgi:hypothetical protein